MSLPLMDMVYCIFRMHAHLMKLSLIFVLRAKLPLSPMDEHLSCLGRLLASLPTSLGFEGHRLVPLQMSRCNACIVLVFANLTALHDDF